MVVGAQKEGVGAFIFMDEGSPLGDLKEALRGVCLASWHCSEASTFSGL